MTCSPKPITNEFLVGTDFSLICTVSVLHTGIQICNTYIKALLRLSNALKCSGLITVRSNKNRALERRFSFIIKQNNESTKLHHRTTKDYVQ